MSNNIRPSTRKDICFDDKVYTIMSELKWSRNAGVTYLLYSIPKDKYMKEVYLRLTQTHIRTNTKQYTIATNLFQKLLTDAQCCSEKL